MSFILSRNPRSFTAADVMAPVVYATQRKAVQAEIRAYKLPRRVHVGPHVTFYFENATTLLYQICEMLFIEKGGDAQIPDELEAYNALLPQGDELVATMMIEIPDAEQRRRVLLTLGHIEDATYLMVGDHRVAGVPADDAERTTADGKASSVQFIHFRFDSAARAAMRAGASVSVGVAHPNYTHLAGLPPLTSSALALDLA
ncbi:MAG: DUF3501 family protein [Alphaproteobacteria bacterium]|nr:DUF3501 family protein [Alphaproteobacteria bacterium]